MKKNNILISRQFHNYLKMLFMFSMIGGLIVIGSIRLFNPKVLGVFTSSEGSYENYQNQWLCVNKSCVLTNPQMYPSAQKCSTNNDELCQKSSETKKVCNNNTCQQVNALDLPEASYCSSNQDCLPNKIIKACVGLTCREVKVGEYPSAISCNSDTDCEKSNLIVFKKVCTPYRTCQTVRATQYPTYPYCNLDLDCQALFKVCDNTYKVCRWKNSKSDDDRICEFDSCGY